MTLAAGGFSTLDWIVLALYLGLLVGTGIAFSRFRPKTAESYFVGERRMPVWAVAISVLATSLSAATFIGAPMESYFGDLTYLSTNLGGLIAVCIVAGFFIPAFYKYNVTTVYQLLERRFGSPSRKAASWMFMIGRIFASGARIYIAAIPLTMILFGTMESTPRHLFAAIAIICTAASLYSLVGGIRSIIWMDVVQTVVFLGAAAAAIFVLLHHIGAPVDKIVDALHDARTPSGQPKTTLLSLGLDPAKPYTLLTAVTGFVLMGVAAYGTDQDLAQRMLTCKSAAKGGQSAFVSILIGVPVVALFLTIGLLLFVYNRGLLGPPPTYEIATNSNQVFPQFVLSQMPAGLSGLTMAGLFAVALTSTMSALNAMSATLITDVYRPLRKGQSESHYLAAGRVGVLFWGAVLAIFASCCVWWQKSNAETLIQFALGVMGLAYAGLLGVYFTALFTRRGSNASVIAALVVGFLAVLITQPPVWVWLTTQAFGPVPEVYKPPVPPSHPLPPESPTIAAIRAFRLAFPWRLTIGAAAAFAVCVMGRSKTQNKSSESAA